MEADERNLVPYEEESGQGGGFTARDAFYILFRHKGKMICFFTLVVTVGALAVLSIPNWVIRRCTAACSGTTSAGVTEAAHV